MGFSYDSDDLNDANADNKRLMKPHTNWPVQVQSQSQAAAKTGEQQAQVRVTATKVIEKVELEASNSLAVSKLKNLRWLLLLRVERVKCGHYN